MPNEYPLTSFIKAFGKAYQTIDLRAALIKNEEQWRIVNMIIRIKLASEDVIRQAYQKHTKGRAIDTDKFKIIQRCLLFSDFEHLLVGISEGLIELDELRIVFDPLKQIAELSGYLKFFMKSENKPAILDWPILRVSRSLSSQNPYYGTLQKDADILRHVEIAGFQNVDLAIKNMLGVEDYTASSINLTLDLDVPSRVDSIAASKKDYNDATFKVNASTHSALTDIMCNVYTWRSSADKKFMQSLLLQKGRLVDNIQEWTGTFAINDTLDERERVEFQLLYKPLGHLIAQDYHVNELFNMEVRNPLFAALSLFCPDDQLNSLLISPKRKLIAVSKKSEKLYEVSIQWLLTCLGFRTVWLHKFEKLIIDNHLYGTVDCLAYHDRKNILLFINCTLAAPSDKELASYREVQRYFEENVFRNTAVRLHSVVFTDAASPSMLINKDALDFDIVRICYREDTSRLLELVKKGYEHRFIDFLNDPLFGRLSK